MRHLRRIVVGVDGSDESFAAARWALREARRNGATLTAVHAWQSFAALPTDAPLQTQQIAACADAAQEVLDAVVKRLRAEPEAAAVDLDPILIPGPVGPVLVDEATDADMLVIGSHGRGALGRVVLGSVSAYCIHHATCSTLIVASRPMALRSAARQGDSRQRRGGGHGFAVGPHSDSVA